MGWVGPQGTRGGTQGLGVIPRVLGVVPRVLGVIPRVLGVAGAACIRNSFRRDRKLV